MGSPFPFRTAVRLCGGIGVAVMLAVTSAPLRADPDLPLDRPLDRAAIEAIIRAYIKDNPEEIVESVRAHQERQAAAAQAKAEEALASSRGELERDPGTPVAGNPDGDVTLVEFFDYQCGYCKKVFPAIRQLIESDGNLRYVLKEFPILGPDSLTASRAALAVWHLEPERYFAFHSALMEARGSLDEVRVLDIAEDLGLDARAIKAKMQSREVNDAVEGIHTLAETLQIRGTPAFVINGQLIPGAVGLDALKELIAAARQG